MTDTSETGKREMLVDVFCRFQFKLSISNPLLEKCIFSQGHLLDTDLVVPFHFYHFSGNPAPSFNSFSIQVMPVSDYVSHYISCVECENDMMGRVKFARDYSLLIFTALLGYPGSVEKTMLPCITSDMFGVQRALLTYL